MMGAVCVGGKPVTVFARSKCHNCYMKWWRKTPDGKASTAAANRRCYNKTRTRPILEREAARPSIADMKKGRAK